MQSGERRRGLSSPAIVGIAGSGVNAGSRPQRRLFLAPTIATLPGSAGFSWRVNTIAQRERTISTARDVTGEGTGAAHNQTVRDLGPYSARNSSKGALLDEAGRIFAALAESHSVESVRSQVLRGNLLVQRSRENRDRIWTSIQQRYLLPQTPWLTRLLAQACQAGPHSPEFISLLYLLYALRDRLTFDFVTTVLCPRAKESGLVVSRDELLDLLRNAAPSQPQIERWSESTRVKLAGSILTALRDFGLLKGKQKKTLVSPALPLSTAEALFRLLVVEGHRGRRLLEDEAWRLFLFSEADVAATLAQLARQGTIRFEKAGATVVLETPAEWEQQR